MIDRIKIWAMSKPWFWKGRTRLGNARFFFEKETYKYGSSISKVRAGAGILLAFTVIGLKSLFWVALILAVSISIENYIRGNSDLLQPLSNSERNYIIEQLRLYAQLLTAIFSIYFATIGIILSAGYTRLRRDIIQLLTTEQVGSIYSRVLVRSAIFCLAATSLPLFGVEPGYLIFVMATFFTLVSSLALFPLGQRLFNFFDLNPLIRAEILPSIVRHIKGAANPRTSASLSNHHSKFARKSLEQLAYIDDRLKSDSKGLKDNLPALSDDYATLLLHYLQHKHKIDQYSYWFPRKRKHQQWFFAGDAATSSALQTSSQLSVEEKADLNWFESEIVERLAGHIQIAFESDDFELALNLIGLFSVRTSTYAKQFQLDAGMQELHRMEGFIKKAFGSKKTKASSNLAMIQIAIADTWAGLGSNLCLETLRRMMTFEMELTRFFDADIWTEKSLRSLPVFLQLELSIIVQRISFEQKIEGKRRSQPKYVQQLAVQKLLQQYKKILSTVCDFHAKVVPGFVDSLIMMKLYGAAVQVILASLHSHWKLPQWFERLAQLLERYSAYAHYTEDQYTLPQINIREMVSRLEKTRDEAVAMLGNPEIVDYIFTHEHNDDLPDHFGQIYFELAEACIRALEHNDEDKFNKVFPMFFSLATFASDSKFADPTLDVGNEFRQHLISAAINDFASILGFAILYSAYYDNPKLSEPALDKFTSLIERAKDKQHYLKRMILISSPHVFSLAASPRAPIRFNWMRAFERRTRQDGYGSQMDFGREKAHTSKIVNEFLESLSDASHLFFAIKVLPLIENVNFEIDYKIEELAQRLNEDKTRQ